MWTSPKIMLRLVIALITFHWCSYGLAQAPAAERCKRVAHMTVGDSTVVGEEFIAGGEFHSPSGDKLSGLPPFCRISIIARPAAGSHIKIELWLPEGSWNGRLLGTGNGGGAGEIVYGPLASGIRRGFATVNTDLGTSPNAYSAVDFPDRWVDFGFRATHEMTVAAKVVLSQYYGMPVSRSYFTGCSTGGQQALSEAQRYPDDYDGILAGAPANDRTHLHSEFLWDYQAARVPSASIVPPDRIALVTRAVLAACAGKDGGAEGDHFLTDPRTCKFRLDSLPICSAHRETDCITSAQLATLKKVYAGPSNPRTNERIYAPLPFGTESSSHGLAYQESDRVAKEQFYPFLWAFGAHWDPMSFDFDHDEGRLDEKLAPLVNANNADLTAFRNHGGKLLMYTGTADPIVPFPDAIEYYEHVVAHAQLGPTANDSAHALAVTQGFFRYYLIPGMAHCSGGTGLTDFGQGISLLDDDLLFKLEQWVEKDVTPSRVLAKGQDPSQDGATFARYLCAYPEFPNYVGGDPKSSASFRCVPHPRGDIFETAERYQH